MDSQLRLEVPDKFLCSLVPGSWRCKNPKNLKNSLSGFQPVLHRHNVPAAAVLPEDIPAALSSCPMVLYVRMDRLVHSTKVLTRFYFAPLTPFSSKLARE